MAKKRENGGENEIASANADSTVAEKGGMNMEQDLKNQGGGGAKKEDAAPATADKEELGSSDSDRVV